MELSVEGYIQNTQKCLKQIFRLSEDRPREHTIDPGLAIQLDLEVALMRECTAKICRSLDRLTATLEHQPQ